MNKQSILLGLRCCVEVYIFLSLSMLIRPNNSLVRPERHYFSIFSFEEKRKCSSERFLGEKHTIFI
jgi:hypothetical protein